VSVDDGETVTDGIVLMETDTVYGTGENPCSDRGFDCTFSETEAGFLFNLHSRALPVNVDSFGQKTLVATLEVAYEAVGYQRRRLLTEQPTFDMRSSTSFGMQSWRPHSMPKGMGVSASMALTATLSARVDRTNAPSFAQAMHAAIVQSLNAESTGPTVYDAQVAVDQIFSDGVAIWSRPQQGKLGDRRRRMLNRVAQELRIEFTFSNIEKPNAMLLSAMVKSFDKQLSNPTSTLMTQPLFAGAVVHDVREIDTSTYVPVTTSTKLASSAMLAAPSLVAALLALLW